MNKRIVLISLIVMAVAILFYFKDEDSKVIKEIEDSQHPRIRNEKEIDISKIKNNLEDHKSDVEKEIVLESRSNTLDPSLISYYKNLIDDKDVCNVVNEVLEKETPKELVFVLTQKLLREGSKNLTPIYNAILYAFQMRDEQPKSEIELAYLTYMIDSKERKKSLRLFRELQRINPDNGAYYFFNLKNLDSKEDISKEISKMVSTRYFKSHFTTLTKGLIVPSFNDSNSYLFALSAYSKLPIPDYSNSYKVLIKHLDSIEDKNKFNAYIEQVIEKNLVSRGLFIELLWNPLEYQVFVNILKRTKPLKAKSLMSYKDLLNTSEVKRVRSKQSVFQRELHKNCDPKKVGRYLEYEKERYFNFQ